MRMTEAQLRKVIRKEILREMEEGMPPQEEKGKLYPGAIAGGIGAAGVLVALERALNYVQSNPIGHDIALKIQQLSDAVQSAMEE
jgi:hypothetical protein